MAKKSNTLLYVGLGAAALFLFMRSKGAKLPFTSAADDGESEGEATTPQRRGSVEVGPTETLSESEYYGQPAASPISRLRQKVQATAEDIESIRETAEGLLPGRSEAGPIDQAMTPGRRRKTLRERLAEARAKRQARRKKRKLKRGLKKKPRKLKRKRVRIPRRRRRLGEMDFI